jgi:heme/copper-type cytochrome/quinol oxidase subunit 3
MSLPRSETATVHGRPGAGSVALRFIAACLAIAGAAILLAMACYRLWQRSFRRALVIALAAGGLFVSVQGYGIAWLLRNQRPSEVALGVNAFATCLTALHAMHFTLAMMLLIWVTLQAHVDRYDHEYYWGVFVCSWFWHALGIVWMGILVVFAFAV